MLARSDGLQYVLEHYGHCDRDSGKQNDCYWGKDSLGRDNGCLKTGWRGRDCKHWHPVEGNELVTLLMLHEYRASAFSLPADRLVSPRTLGCGEPEKTGGGE